MKHLEALALLELSERNGQPREEIMRYFAYLHLPAPLQAVSMQFCELAKTIVTTLPRSAERTVALRKLLESKDAAVRAAL